MTLKEKAVENVVVKKEEMLVTSIFSFTRNVFYPINSLPHNPNF